MPECFNCKLFFSNESSLVSHIHNSHAYLPTFTCAEAQCGRSFPLLNSFRKHRNSVHNNCQNDVQRTAEVYETPVSEEQVRPQMKKKKFPSENHSTSYGLNDESPSESTFEDFPSESTFEGSPSESTFEASPIVHFLAKLHSYLKLPRKRVVSLVQDVDNFINLHIQSLENKVIDSIQKKSNDEELMEAIQNQFQAHKNIFFKLKSEHLHLKEFRKLGI